MILTDTSKQIKMRPTFINDLVVMNNLMFRGGKPCSTRGKIKRHLLNDFHPCPYSVVIGRGKTALNAVGNRRLTVVASTFLEKYSQANTKPQKTAIVSQIVDIFEEACPVGAFVKFSDGCWWEVSDNVAREKVGHVLRDMLHAKYRSSSKSKVARRRKLREEARSSSNVDSDSASQSSVSSDKEEERVTQQKPSSSTNSSLAEGEETTPSKRRSMPILKHNNNNTQQTLSLKKRPASCPSFGAGDKYKNKEPRMAVMDKAISKLFDDTFCDYDPKVEPQHFRNSKHSLSDESIKKLGCQQDLRKILVLDDTTLLHNSDRWFPSLNDAADDIFNVFDDELDRISPAIFDS